MNRQALPIFENGKSGASASGSGSGGGDGQSAVGVEDYANLGDRHMLPQPPRTVPPRMVHQLWKGRCIPEKWAPLVVTWGNQPRIDHYVLWTDAAMDRFVLGKETKKEKKKIIIIIIIINKFLR